MLDLMPAEILKPREVKHRAALDAKDLPAFLAQLDAYDGDPHTVHALRLLMLTATRPGEVRGARWDEVDMDAAMWTIPAERMKMRQEHRIPLSSQALELLQSMQALSGGRELVFPSPFYPSKPLSENTFNSAMARMGYKNLATAHGFRALFSTVANETGWRPDVIERQLAHKERNEVRAAYHRSTYGRAHQAAAVVGRLPGGLQKRQGAAPAPARWVVWPSQARPAAPATRLHLVHKPPTEAAFCACKPGCGAAQGKSTRVGDDFPWGHGDTTFSENAMSLKH